MRPADRYSLFRAILGVRYSPQEKVQHCSVTASNCKAKWMCWLSRQRHCFAARRERPVRKAGIPQNMGQVASREHGKVRPEKHGQRRLASLWMNRQNPLDILAGGGQLAYVEQGHGMDEVSGCPHAVGLSGGGPQEMFAPLKGGLQAAANGVK